MRRFTSLDMLIMGMATATAAVGLLPPNLLPDTSAAAETREMLGKALVQGLEYFVYATGITAGILGTFYCIGRVSQFVSQVKSRYAGAQKYDKSGK